MLKICIPPVNICRTYIKIVTFNIKNVNNRVWYQNMIYLYNLNTNWIMIKIKCKKKLKQMWVVWSVKIHVC